MLANKIFTDVLLGAKHLLFIVFSFLFCMDLVPLFALHYSNPYNISNFFSSQFFSPETNFTKILFVIFGTIILYHLLWYLDRRGKNGWFKLLVIGFFLGNYFLIHALPDYTAQGGIDTFSVGEQMSPTFAFLQGKHLFSQIYFFHGAGDDVLMTALGFAIFGLSIGSYILFQRLQQLIAALGFYLLLGRVVRNNTAFLLTSALAYGSTYVNFYYIRDLAVWMSLALILKLFANPMGYRARAAIMGTLGILAMASCFFSVDRGLLLLGLDAMVVIVWLLFERSKNGFYHFSRGVWRTAYKDVLWLLGGIGAVFIAALAMLGVHDLGAFIKMDLIDLPKYKGLISEYPFPSINTPYGFSVWIPILVMIVLVFMVIELIINTRKKLTLPIILTVILTLFAVAFLRSGVGRSDLGHIAYACTPLFIAITYTLPLYLTHVGYKPTSIGLGSAATLGLLVIFVLVGKDIDIKTLSTMPNYRRDEIRAFLHIPKVSDNYWYPESVQDASSYIDAHSTPSDTIFAFTANPIYYYATKRLNPSRFYISWFADPQPYTNELLGDLKAHPPKFVIYQDGANDNPDQVSMTERIPEVNTWILNNYSPDTTFGTIKLMKHR